MRLIYALLQNLKARIGLYRAMRAYRRVFRQG